MNTIKVKANELKVGDKFANSGATITSVEPYTLEGYNIDYVRVVDTSLKTCMAAHFPAACELNIQAR